MSVLPNSSRHHETHAPQTSAEPHVARRAVRYAAASNAQGAMMRQFPHLFMSSLAQTAIVQTQNGDGDATQTA
ncbi:MAG TPA: hypothetical protein VIM53_00615 [Candidatus Saccharimonadales bacterium]